jgi:XRE family transcriptional regulator, aerobic/anaerobic benzoate catabolism transcriptional regulator
MTAMLQELGLRVRELRRRKRMTREKLADRSGLSVRFLADIESGKANISLTRLADLALALKVPLALLIPEAHRAEGGRATIALVGLRGAGKTTIGKKLASRLRRQFVELDELIEKVAGLTLQNIFEVHGEEYYRRLEYDVLVDFLSQKRSVVLATGGGLVSREETYTLLRQHCITFWLRAQPEDHWNRVVKQDPRPVTNYPNAFSQLQMLLQRREPLYGQADFIIDTSTLGVSKSVQRIESLL